MNRTEVEKRILDARESLAEVNLEASHNTAVPLEVAVSLGRALAELRRSSKIMKEVNNG